MTRRLQLRHPWNIAAGVAVALLTPVIVIGLSVGVAVRATTLPPEAAFRVNDLVVTKESLQNSVRTLQSFYGLTAPADASRQSEYRQATTHTILLGMVLQQEAEKRGLTTSEEQARALLDSFIKQNVTPPDQVGFLQYLRDSALSEQDVIGELKRQRETTALYHAITDGAASSVTQDDVRSYFEGHSSEMVIPERRHLRNIVVDTEDQARELEQQLRDGGRFENLASVRSLDGQTRDHGGDLGTLSADQLDPEFARSAFAAAPNSYFGPVRTSRGWNVGQVLEITPAVPLSYEQAREPLLNRLRQQRADVAWSEWQSHLFGTLRITYADGYGPVARG